MGHSAPISDSTSALYKDGARTVRKLTARFLKRQQFAPRRARCVLILGILISAWITYEHSIVPASTLLGETTVTALGPRSTCRVTGAVQT
jgi:hypothetical protein